MTYRVVLENKPIQISCHRLVRCIEAKSAKSAGEIVCIEAMRKSPERGWRVIAVTETTPGSRETGYYRHGEAHLALKEA